MLHMSDLTPREHEHVCEEGSQPLGVIESCIACARFELMLNGTLGILESQLQKGASNVHLHLWLLMMCLALMLILIMLEEE